MVHQHGLFMVRVVDQPLLAHTRHLEDQPIDDLPPHFVEAVAVALELFLYDVKVHGRYNVKEGVYY